MHVMTRPTLAALVVGFAAALLAGGGGKPAATTHTVQLNNRRFTLPVGFTIEVAAQGPLVDRPITADFDEQGRLYVGESSGTNAKVQEQLRTRPHRVVRLED